MKNFYRKLTGCVIAGSLIVSSSAFALSNEPQLYLNSNKVDLSEPIKIKDGRSYIPLRALSEKLDFIVSYDSSKRRITLKRPSSNIELYVGKKEVMVNGKNNITEEPPFLSNGVTYVPVRFISDVMNSKLQWSQKDKTITIQDNNFNIFKNKNKTIWISQKTGEIFVLDKNNIVKLQSKEAEKIAENITENMEVEYTEINPNSFLLTLDDEHMASMTIFRNTIQLLVKNNTIVKQTVNTYHGQYASSEYKVRLASLPYLTDGTILYSISKDGTIDKEYNLAELSDQNGPFIVEYFKDDVILARPQHNLQLTLIDLKNKKSMVLYKELLNNQEQKIWDESIGDVGDPLYIASLIKLSRVEHNKFYFTYLSRLNGEKKNAVYVIQ